MVEQALQRLLRHQDLTREEARGVLEQVFSGEASEAQLAAVLTGLAMKGETVDEIVGFAEAMRAAVADIGLNGAAQECVDTCGTGGNPRPIFNISTAAALVAAGAGARVAKHGNRTSTSVCGSADVLEAMGVKLEFPAERLGACLREVGLVFLFAPLLHTAMRHVMPVRRALKVRTVFNILGPLTNPAGARAQVVGVATKELIAKMAESLQLLGTRHSFVVRSADGLGELSTTAVNHVAEIRAGTIQYYDLDARDLGLARAELQDLACGSKAEAEAMFRAVLRGESGSRLDMVCLNAAAALVAGGIAANWSEGLERARAAIASGAARAKLEQLVAFTRGLTAGAHAG